MPRPPNCRIFIGNLASEATSKEELRSIFIKYGEITEDPIIRRCFGFIQYDNEESTQRAMKKENGRQIGHRKIELSLADNREPKYKSTSSSSSTSQRKEKRRDRRDRSSAPYSRRDRKSKDSLPGGKRSMSGRSRSDHDNPKPKCYVFYSTIHDEQMANDFRRSLVSSHINAECRFFSRSTNFSDIVSEAFGKQVPFLLFMYTTGGAPLCDLHTVYPAESSSVRKTIDLESAKSIMIERIRYPHAGNSQINASSMGRSYTSHQSSSPSYQNYSNNVMNNSSNSNINTNSSTHSNLNNNYNWNVNRSSRSEVMQRDSLYDSYQSNNSTGNSSTRGGSNYSNTVANNNTHNTTSSGGNNNNPHLTSSVLASLYQHDPSILQNGNDRNLSNLSNISELLANYSNSYSNAPPTGGNSNTYSPPKTSSGGNSSNSLNQPNYNGGGVGNYISGGSNYPSQSSSNQSQLNSNYSSNNNSRYSSSSYQNSSSSGNLRDYSPTTVANILSSSSAAAYSSGDSSRYHNNHDYAPPSDTSGRSPVQPNSTVSSMDPQQLANLIWILQQNQANGNVPQPSSSSSSSQNSSYYPTSSTTNDMNNYNVNIPHNNPPPLPIVNSSRQPSSNSNTYDMYRGRNESSSNSYTSSRKPPISMNTQELIAQQLSLQRSAKYQN